GTGYRAESAAGDTTGFTSETLALLTRNYSVVRAEDAAICGRPARVVEARRPDGSPAGRFWIDRETGLMLHRELIDATGRPVVVTGFSEISFTAPPAEPVVLGQPRGGLLRFPGSSAGGAVDGA
ncbi:sigma-E factor regulatory protein RseB domain-containing protein, partial [Actinomadura bangladeshensis]